MTKSRFFLYWREQGPMAWCRTGSSPAAGVAEPDRLAGLVGGLHLVVLLPVLHISVHVPRLPTRSERRIRESLPYALEEELACDPEDNHFAFRKVADKRLHTAVIQRSVLADYLHRIRLLGLQPAQLIPEVCLFTGKQPVILLQDETFTLMLDTTEVFCGPMTQLADAVGLCPELPMIWDFRLQAREPLAALAGCSQAVTAASAQVALVQAVADYSPARVINLLQGEYASTTDSLNWQYYRYAALTTVFISAVGLLTLWLRHDILETHYRDLTMQAEQIYRTTFPQAKEVVDPRVQMQQQVQKLQQAAAARSTDFIGLLANTGEVLQRFGKGRITRISFDQGKLRVDLRVPTESIIQQLVTALRALHTVTVTLEPVRRDKQQYVTTVRIQPIQDRGT
ncbi:MAG: type II secretion system protein GspL [Pseudomonadota bacterium]